MHPMWNIQMKKRKSRSGGVVGFESDTIFYFGFAGEAELIVWNKI